MWNKSYKYNNTYTVHLKHSKNTYKDIIVVVWTCSSDLETVNAYRVFMGKPCGEWLFGTQENEEPTLKWIFGD
jgi:hypothetical protein